MKQRIKGLLSVALCLVLIIQSASINVYASTKVKINKTKASIYVGKTVQLKITGTKKKVTWKSSNKKVATVTTKGKVKGIKKGTAKITATVNKKKYTCKVTVKKKVNNNTSTTSKPTTSTKPSTTNKPVISDTIISNFSSLKAYITKYGQINSSGNKFIKTSLSNNSFGIVYDATNSKYTFVVSGTTSNGKTDYALSMDVKETYLGDGEIGCAIIITNGFCAELDTTSSLQNINGKSELNWTVTSSTGGDNASWISMANTVLNIGYIGWDLLVYETLNLNIKDFGFGGDIQTSVATPTNTSIVIATPIATSTITPTIAPTEIAVEAPAPTNSASYDTAYVKGKYTELKDYIDKNGESLSSKSKCIEGTSQLVSGEAIAYNIQYNGTKFAFVAYTDSFWCRFYIDALNNNYSEITVMTLNNDSYTATSYFEASKFLNEDSYLDTLEWGINRASFNNDESKKYAKEVFSLSVNYCEQLLNEKLNMALKDLGIGTGIIYVENVVTPVPWITPSPTPKPQTLEGRYDIVKKYFEENGKSDDEDNMYIQAPKTEDSTYGWKIVYSNKTNEIYVTIEWDYVKCSFTFNTLNSDNVNARYYMLRWEPRFCGHEAITTFKASEYNNNNDMIWETVSSSYDVSYTPTDKSMSEKFQKSYDIANNVFVKNIGLSLEDLGFGTCAQPNTTLMPDNGSTCDPTIIPTSTANPTVIPTVIPTATPNPMLPNFDIEGISSRYSTDDIAEPYVVCIGINNKGDEDIIFKDEATVLVTDKSYTGELEKCENEKIVTGCAIAANTKGYLYISFPYESELAENFISSHILIDFYYKEQEYFANISARGDGVWYYK